MNPIWPCNWCSLSLSLSLSLSHFHFRRTHQTHAESLPAKYTSERSICYKGLSNILTFTWVNSFWCIIYVTHVNYSTCVEHFLNSICKWSTCPNEWKFISVCLILPIHLSQAVNLSLHVCVWSFLLSPVSNLIPVWGPASLAVKILSLVPLYWASDQWPRWWKAWLFLFFPFYFLFSFFLTFSLWPKWLNRAKIGAKVNILTVQ